MKKKMALLYGGKSAEHEVSLLTAKAVIGALDTSKFDIYPIYIDKKGDWIAGPLLETKVEKVENLVFKGIKSDSALNALSIPEENEKRYDVVFPLLHGPNGEDGTVQGLLEILNLPYVGNGILASSAGMDKVMMKNIFAHAGLEQAKYVHYLRSEWKKNTKECYQEVKNKLGFPCFVKPANLGSSVGISKCLNEEELEKAFIEAFQFDRKVIVEEGIIGRELEVAVLGNDDPKCSVPGELVLQKDFYDYKAKYLDGNTGLIIPAKVTDAQYEILSEMAIKAFKALDCSGLVRADFFLTTDGTVLINEVNTMPGFTPYSMYPLLWQETGLPYSALIEKLVSLAIERHEEKQLIKFTF
ncbi:MAG: D-alanine--D-alanine ligase family protein [Bacillales bacterium]|jgi:D-alanine-D-alanine ligase|nr:D-alanine--D-alanine ligase family protein [Bacillales bacterium]